MPKLNQLLANDIIRALGLLGFQKIRQKGSHIILKKDSLTGKVGCVIPDHKRVAFGTLKSILKQAQVSLQEFINALEAK